MRETMNTSHTFEKSDSYSHSHAKGYLLKIQKSLTILLTFFLPIKFVAFMSTPESVPLYRFDLISLIVMSWPATIFQITSGINLLLAVVFLLTSPNMPIRKSFFVFSFLQILLATVSCVGLVNASALVYADQMLPHIFSMSAYAVSLVVLCSADTKALTHIKLAFLVGSAFAVYAGLRQYFVGFHELREYLEEQAAQAGRNVINDQFAIRLEEARVQGDFSSCNTYGAFLAALLPFAVMTFWRFGNEYVSPPVLSRRLFAVIAIVSIGFTLYCTGSRGAFLALFLAFTFLAVSLPMKRKKRVILFAICFFFIAVLISLIVMTGRGGGSLVVRLDYWQAAIRMLLRHPLCGTGWGDFFHDYGQLRFWIDKEAPHTPHNMIFLFASQCGIPGLLVSCAILIYPLYFAVRRISCIRLSLMDSSMWCAFAVPMTLFTLIFAAQFDLGYETPAYTAMLTIFSLDVLDDNSEYVALSTHFRIIVSIFLLLFSLTCIEISCRQFHGEITAAALNEELDARFSRTHQVTYISNFPRINALLKTAAAADPHSPFIWSSSAEYVYRLGERSIAMQWIDEAIRRSPERAFFYLERARMRYIMSGIIDENCRADLQILRTLSPKNPDFQLPDEQLLNHTNNE